MSNQFTLDAELRSDKGKGASRRLRRSNKVPAIMYGADAEPTSLLLDHNQVLRRLENEAFYSHILTIQVDGKAHEAVLRDMQRHPSRPIIMHMDFQRISQDRDIHVRVPLHFINEEKCEGVKLSGGLISKILNEVEVICLPRFLPEFIEIDMTKIQLGQSIHLSELVIPEGVRLAALAHGVEHDTAVVSVHKPRAVEEEVKPAAEVAAEGAAAPAAGAEDAKDGKKADKKPE
jgi:large subunit ribosomal protein L25